MKKVIVCLLIAAMLIQIGCSSITQIPLPIEETKSESDIRSLNYFGEKLSSIIILTDSIEVEAYWLKLRDDKIYFLTEGLDDTTSIGVDKIKTVKFYDMYGGCMKGGVLGFVISGLETLVLWAAISGSTGDKSGGAAILVAYPVTIFLSILYGVSFMGGREFNFVQNKSAKE